MISKQQAQKNGIKTIESNQILDEEKNEKLEQLKKLIPNLVNSDNQVDTNALQDFIDLAHTTSNNKGYELTFAGKGIARAKADSETTKELQLEKEQSKNFDTTENVVIRGDNLEVLKILKQNYFEQIKMIYIDPPYNTESENFIYNDNFKKSEEDLINDFGLNENTTDFLHNVYGTRSHSGWLAFMYPRLKLARDLLRDDGVIFISIDDNEQANLKIMCDEIFGEENFVASLVWKNKSGGGNDSNHFINEHEYLFCIAKNLNEFETNLDKEYKFSDNAYPFEDENGKYGLVTLDKSSLGYLKSLDFEIKDKKGNSYFPRNEKGEKNFRWRWGKEKVEKEYDKLVFKDGKVYSKFYQKEGIKPKTMLFEERFGRTTSGGLRVKDLFDQKVFSYAKPIQLLNFLLKISTNKDDLILDFFAGSGTTGDAVMQLNAEDGRTRKFILVQWDEEIDKKKNQEAYNFCIENKFKPVISSITIERLNRAGEKIKKDNAGKLDFDGKNLDIGYQVFSLTEKPQLTEDENGLFKIENERTETINTLYNMLCATGKPLHTKIETIIKDKIYKVDDAIYILGTEQCAVRTLKVLEPYKESQIFIDGWADISLEHWLNMEVGQKENIVVVY